MPITHSLKNIIIFRNPALKHIFTASWFEDRKILSSGGLLKRLMTNTRERIHHIVIVAVINSDIVVRNIHIMVMLPLVIRTLIMSLVNLVIARVSLLCSMKV